MRKIVSIVAWSAQWRIDSFPCLLLLSWPLDNGVVARKIGHVLSANSKNIFSSIWSQIPCGLFSSIEDHFFSEPGPTNDHCPIPNFFALIDDFSICQAFSFIVFRSTSVVEHRYRYAEQLLQCEIFRVNNGLTIVRVILHHECRWFHRYSHKHSPNHKMFFSFSCNVGNSFLSFSHPIHEWSRFYR